ncbi:MAG: hydrogenase nickel incorporation protein HypB [Vicinamibacterales bacterium]
MSIITIERKLLEKNDEVAALNRVLFKQHGLFVFNLVSSPGAGKTSLLEAILKDAKGNIAIGVIEGDVQTDLDAQRVAKFGVPAVQVVTRGGCHLEAPLVRQAVEALDLSTIKVLIIENVGNLVCPANFDLGEELKVVVLSTTEGDDKPLKYPAMFRNAAVLIINKIDLLPYVPCDLEAMKRNARQINPGLLIFETSATTGQGIGALIEWIGNRVERARA